MSIFVIIFYVYGSLCCLCDCFIGSLFANLGVLCFRRAFMCSTV